MSLSIGVGDGTLLVPDGEQPSLRLENDGMYWSLYPFFAHLREECGQYIDHHGDASFAGEDLIALKQALAAARVWAEAQPESGYVHVGVQIQPVHRELYKRVERSGLLEVIDRFQDVIARAESLGRPVVCFGD